LKRTRIVFRQGLNLSEVVCDSAEMQINNDNGKAVLSIVGAYYYASDIGADKFYMSGVALQLPDPYYAPAKTILIDYVVKVSEQASIIISADDIERIVTMDVDDAAYRSNTLGPCWLKAYRDADVANQMSIASKEACDRECDVMNNSLILERKREDAAYALKYSKAKWYKKLFMRK